MGKGLSVFARKMTRLSKSSGDEKSQVSPQSDNPDSYIQASKVPRMCMHKQGVM